MMELLGSHRRFAHGFIPVTTSASDLDPCQEASGRLRGGTRTPQPLVSGANNHRLPLRHLQMRLFRPLSLRGSSGRFFVLPFLVEERHVETKLGAGAVYASFWPIPQPLEQWAASSPLQTVPEVL